MAQQSSSTQGPSKDQSSASSTAKSSDQSTSDKGLQNLTQGIAKDASELGGGLKNLAGSVAEEAKHVVENQLASQKGRVVDGLGGVAQALRQVSGAAQKPEHELSPAMLPYIEKAADQVDKVSAYFDKKSLGEVARDVEDFARREPAMFLGGEFVLGLLGGRFLKASPRPANSGSSRSSQSAQRGGGFDSYGRMTTGGLGGASGGQSARPPVGQRASGQHDRGESREGAQGKSQGATQGTGRSGSMQDSSIRVEPQPTQVPAQTATKPGLSPAGDTASKDGMNPSNKDASTKSTFGAYTTENERKATPGDAAPPSNGGSANGGTASKKTDGRTVGS